MIVEHVKKDEEVRPASTSTTEKYVDMFKAGIIDPTKVARTALQNAAIGGEPAAHDRGAGHRDSGEEEVRRQPPGGGGGGGYDDMY